MSKIFLKINVKFDLKCSQYIVYKDLYCVVTKLMNSNEYYITTSCIPYNTYSYSYVIIIIVY